MQLDQCIESLNALYFQISNSTGTIANKPSGEGIVALYAMPNPFLLNKICLNQINHLIHNYISSSVSHIVSKQMLCDLWN